MARDLVNTEGYLPLFAGADVVKRRGLIFRLPTNNVPGDLPGDEHTFSDEFNGSLSLHNRVPDWGLWADSSERATYCPSCSNDIAVSGGLLQVQGESAGGISVPINKGLNTYTFEVRVSEQPRSPAWDNILDVGFAESFNMSSASGQGVWLRFTSVGGQLKVALYAGNSNTATYDVSPGDIVGWRWISWFGTARLIINDEDVEESLFFNDADFIQDWRVFVNTMYYDSTNLGPALDYIHLDDEVPV